MKHQIALLLHNNVMAQVSASNETTVQQATTAVDPLAETNIRRRRPDQLEHLGVLAQMKSRLTGSGFVVTKVRCSR
jgi:hypothetical protein